MRTLLAEGSWPSAATVSWAGTRALLITCSLQTCFRTFKVSSRGSSPTGVAGAAGCISRVGPVKWFLSRPAAVWERTSVRTKGSEFQAGGGPGDVNRPPR